MTATTTATIPIEERGYVHPEVLVSTDWLAEHRTDPSLRLLESNEDLLLYGQGHIPGAQQVDWLNDLNDPLVRDYVGSAAFERLLQRLGVGEETTVVLYGDKNNWWATYTFWVFRLFAFPENRLRILDGGRAAWIAEGRVLTTEQPALAPSLYRAPQRDDTTIRAFQHQVLEHVARGQPLVDVRSPDEYSGRKLHMPEYPQEGALRGGHIPGARSVPWARAANADGTFKTGAELLAIYRDEQGLNQGDNVIAYCRIGERSSHTWFVLTYLLGYGRVRNYDGSWTEWGNSVGAPVER